MSIKQGSIIYYDLTPHNLKGYGKIVGKSHTDQPILGAGYIIEPEIENHIKNDIYPYSHFVLFESQFRVLSISEVRKRKLDKIQHGII